MNSFVFFLLFIPILGFILLNINFILAAHNPYKEKKTPFECGYHSFLAQNRTQFTISFFIFALLFLVFDLEIVLIYPYTVSNYFNGIYGIGPVLVFIIILTVGFQFELGNNALSIDTKQYKGLNSKFFTLNFISRFGVPLFIGLMYGYWFRFIVYKLSLVLLYKSILLAIGGIIAMFLIISIRRLLKNETFIRKDLISVLISGISVFMVAYYLSPFLSIFVCLFISSTSSISSLIPVDFANINRHVFSANNLKSVFSKDGWDSIFSKKNWINFVNSFAEQKATMIDNNDLLDNTETRDNKIGNALYMENNDNNSNSWYTEGNDNSSRNWYAEDNNNNSNNWHTQGDSNNSNNWHTQGNSNNSNNWHTQGDNNNSNNWYVGDSNNGNNWYTGDNNNSNNLYGGYNNNNWYTDDNNNNNNSYTGDNNNNNSNNWYTGDNNNNNSNNWYAGDNNNNNSNNWYAGDNNNNNSNWHTESGNNNSNSWYTEANYSNSNNWYAEDNNNNNNNNWYTGDNNNNNNSSYTEGGDNNSSNNWYTESNNNNSNSWYTGGGNNNSWYNYWGYYPAPTPTPAQVPAPVPAPALVPVPAPVPVPVPAPAPAPILAPTPNVSQQPNTTTQGIPENMLNGGVNWAQRVREIIFVKYEFVEGYNRPVDVKVAQLNKVYAPGEQSRIATEILARVREVEADKPELYHVPIWFFQSQEHAEFYLRLVRDQSPKPFYGKITIEKPGVASASATIRALGFSRSRRGKLERISQGLETCD